MARMSRLRRQVIDTCKERDEEIHRLKLRVHDLQLDLQSHYKDAEMLRARERALLNYILLTYDRTNPAPG